MRIGTVREIKDSENRVGLVPGGVDTLVAAGHEVLVEAGAGRGSLISDQEFATAGAQIAATREEVFDTCDLLIKVKEAQPEEVELLREGQVLYTYLHLAPLPELTEGLLSRGVTAIAYETITAPDGSLPLLTPMSEVAGRMAIQEGAHHLHRSCGGSGILLGGVPGVPRGRAVIVGGGVVGLNAAKLAVGIGAEVTILEKSSARMRYLDDIFGSRVTTLKSSAVTLASSLAEADLVVGAVLVPGAAAPRIITREMIAAMREGAVIVDVAVDQGGCCETTRPTTHSKPTYVVDGVVHYCVANMPGAMPRTSTYALTNVTLEYALTIANHGFEEAVRRDSCLRPGVNTYAGRLTCRPVAESQGREFQSLDELIA